VDGIAVPDELKKVFIRMPLLLIRAKLQQEDIWHEIQLIRALEIGSINNCFQQMMIPSASSRLRN
jgi:hypothetical protein